VNACKTIRVNAELAEKVESLSHLIGPRFSMNAFAEQCVAEMVALMSEQPEKRAVPHLVTLVDEARRSRENRAPFAPTPPALPAAIASAVEGLKARSRR
jgi:hypothetical protein